MSNGDKDKRISIKKQEYMGYGNDQIVTIFYDSNDQVVDLDRGGVVVENITKICLLLNTDTEEPIIIDILQPESYLNAIVTKRGYLQILDIK